MKLELDVKQLNNEDVISTSCETKDFHIYVTDYNPDTKNLTGISYMYDPNDDCWYWSDYDDDAGKYFTFIPNKWYVYTGDTYVLSDDQVQNHLKGAIEDKD